MTRLICAFVALFTSVALAADLPRYKLPVGRALSFEESAETKSGGEASPEHTTCRAVVLRENPDGSRHVVLRFASNESYVRIACAELFADGRVKMDPMSSMMIEVERYFPRLPDDEAQLKSGWQSTNAAGTSTTHYAAESETGDGLTISTNQESPIDRIYLLKRTNKLQFDREKGAIVAGEASFTQEWSSHSTGSGKMKLAQDETIEPGELATLAKDYDTFFAAKDQYEKMTRNIAEHPESAQKLIDEAKGGLETAWSSVKSAEVQAELGRMKKQHDQYAKYEIESAQKQAGVLNKEAIDWSAQDLDGKEWKLSDLKGKVVVMDFWYRGCGWCMYAMPQVRQLSVDYKDKPVVFFGMNTDQKEEDAKFVVKEFDLKYPIIKAKEIPQKYGVQGFPTLVIVDQKGNVAAFDVGYSPDLHDKVSKKLDELLKAPG